MTCWVQGLGTAGLGQKHFGASFAINCCFEEARLSKNCSARSVQQRSC